MEDWKAKRIKLLNEFVGDRKYILLRSIDSWNNESDVDILCPKFPQNQDLKRYEYKNLQLDIFKTYKIKKIEIYYDVLKDYVTNENQELDLDVETSLFFLKDYIHLTKFRKNKHKFYNKPYASRELLKRLHCPLILSKFLVPSSSIFTFYLRSFFVKIIYYLN